MLRFKNKYNNIKLSVFIQSVVITFVFLIQFPAQTFAWTQNEFVIATYFDPTLTGNTDTTNLVQVARDSTRYKLAKNAYINLLSGMGNATDQLNASHMSYNLFIASKVGLKYLTTDTGEYKCYYLTSNETYSDANAASMISHYKSLPFARRQAQYGYNIKDEPGMDNNTSLFVKSLIKYINVNDTAKLAYINLLPKYGFASRSLYEAYLDFYLSNTDTLQNPNVVSYDYYPFNNNSSLLADYFYNINIIRKKAGNKPFWFYAMSVYENGFVDLDSNKIRFMVFCPIAYGAKGYGYFTYEKPNNSNYYSAPIDSVGGTTPTQKYFIIKNINWFVKNVVGPKIMNSKSLGVYHKSTLPTNEVLDNTQILNRYNAPLLKTMASPYVLAGIFKDKTDPTTYYLFVVNKNLTSISTFNIEIKGNYSNKIYISPSVVGYSGDTAYSSPNATYYNSSTNLTCFTMPAMVGGEGRFVKITNVSAKDTRYGCQKTDYNGSGAADLSVKADDGSWLIDYDNSFGDWDVIYNGGACGGADAHPVPADYDGDGKADVSVKYDFNGKWYIDYAANGLGSWDYTSSSSICGDSTFHPVPADYDGDGKTDIAVKSNDGQWKIDYAANGFGSWDVVYGSGSCGGADAHPVPADYDGDGKADVSVKYDFNGKWYIDYAADGFGSWNYISNSGVWGDSSYHAVPADYDGDGIVDLSTKGNDGIWQIDYAAGGFGALDWSSNGHYVGYGDSSYHALNKKSIISNNLAIVPAASKIVVYNTRGVQVGAFASSDAIVTRSALLTKVRSNVNAQFGSNAYIVKIISGKKVETMRVMLCK